MEGELEQQPQPASTENGDEQAAKGSAVKAAIAAAEAAMETGEQRNELQDPIQVQDIGGQRVLASKSRASDEGGEDGEGGGAEAADELAPTDDIGSGLTVRLPPRHENDAPLEITCKTQEEADRVRMAFRAGLRRDQFFAAKADLESLKAEVQEVVDMIELDPANFVYEQVPEQYRAALAAHLLADPNVAAQLEELQGLDPERLRADRLEARQRLQAQVASRKVSRQAAQAIRDCVEKMLPESWGDAQAQALRNDLLRDATDFLNANPGTILRPADLPALVASRLKLYGVDPEAAAAAALADGPPPARVAREAAARGAGQKFAKRAVTRRSASAVPGAGAGSPAAGPSLPKGESVKQRVKTLRQRFGLA